MVWLEALFKRVTDGISGRGGVEAFCGYFDQIDFIAPLAPLRSIMKNQSIWFETALAKCNKEMLKRPENIREQEVSRFMGAWCPKCHREVSILSISKARACSCGERFKPSYVAVMRQLLALQIEPTPEAIMMYRGYDKIADAYVAAFKAYRHVMAKTAEKFGWEQFRIEDPQLRNYMDQYFLGRLAGESKIPREEKQVLQFIIRANIANLELEKCVSLIRLALDVVKFGYMYEVLGCVEANSYYDKCHVEYNRRYDIANREIREVLAANPEDTGKPRVRINPSAGGYYPPCVLMPHNCWDSGRISKEIVLEPIYRMPIFPKADQGSLQLIIANIGGGKTILLSGIVATAVLQKGEFVYNALADKSNSLSLACLPLFGYDKRTNHLLHTLTEELGVPATGIPSLTLTVLTKGEEIRNSAAHPPTIYDRVLEVEDPRGFDVDFDRIIAELKKIAESYGYSKPVGLVNVRNLDRVDTKANTNVDVQVAVTLLTAFDGWRKSHLAQSCRVIIDELSYMAPTQLNIYGGDASRSGATISDFIKESRRNATSFDGGTQAPTEILPELRTSATNLFFRDLPISKDKSKSQLDYVLESLQLYDPSIKTVIRDIVNRGLFTKGHYWFWYNRTSRKVEVIRPCPPPFMPQDPKKTPKELYKMYEKQTGKMVLCDSWADVPRIEVKKGHYTSKKGGDKL